MPEQQRPTIFSSPRIKTTCHACKYSLQVNSGTDSRCLRRNTDSSCRTKASHHTDCVRPASGRCHELHGKPVCHNSQYGCTGTRRNAIHQCIHLSPQQHACKSGATARPTAATTTPPRLSLSPTSRPNGGQAWTAPAPWKTSSWQPVRWA